MDEVLEGLLLESIELYRVSRKMRLYAPPIYVLRLSAKETSAIKWAKGLAKDGLIEYHRSRAQRVGKIRHAFEFQVWDYKNNIIIEGKCK
jgi:hypothetical protein